MRGKEFQSQLDRPDPPFQPARQTHGFVKIVGVEGANYVLGGLVSCHEFLRILGARSLYQG